MIEIDGKHYKLEEAWVTVSDVATKNFGGSAYIFSGANKVKKAFVLVEVEDE